MFITLLKITKSCFAQRFLRSGNIVRNESFETELRETCFVTRKTPIFLKHRITSHVHLKKTLNSVFNFIKKYIQQFKRGCFFRKF